MSTVTKYEKIDELRAKGSTLEAAAKAAGTSVSSYYANKARAKKLAKKAKKEVNVVDAKQPHLVTFKLPAGNDTVFIVAGSSEKIIATLDKVAGLLK